MQKKKQCTPIRNYFGTLRRDEEQSLPVKVVIKKNKKCLEVSISMGFPKKNGHFHDPLQVHITAT